MKKEMVGDVPGNVLGMLADVLLKLRHGVLTPEELERFSKRRNPFETVTDLVADWQAFYRDDEFGIALDSASIRIPERRRGFDRLIVGAEGITPQAAYEACAKNFPCRKWTEKSLDEVIDFSFQVRSGRNGSYAVWLRDRVEADEELKNLSADILREREIPGITLEERLLYELKYFKETGRHLDIRNTTLCAGSRYLDGLVPGVEWFSGYGKLNVYWYDPASAFDSLCIRQAVS